MHFTEPAFQPGSHAAHGHHRPAQHHASPSSNMPPAVPTGRTPRPLGKATSFADLRFGKSKLLRRFHQRKGDFDFGCAGEESLGALDGDRDGDPAHLAPSFYSERPPPVPAKSARPHDTPRSSIDGPAPSTSALPPVPPPRPAPYRFPLKAPPTAEELRRLEREREEALAAQAALEYMQTSSHARKHSRSSSSVQAEATASMAAIVDGMQTMRTAPGMSRRPSQAAAGGASPDSAIDEYSTRDLTSLAPAASFAEYEPAGRPRSGSIASSTSRPRTNDSLPSFVETASTIESNGSFPPSPVHSPSLRNRPACFGGGVAPSAVKVDLEAIANQPRGYSFI